LRALVDSDAEKFVLLPADGDHSEALFPASAPIHRHYVAARLATATENLPAGVDVHRFVGRNADIVGTLRLFSQRRERLVTVCGERGCGKTALAVRAVR
jgi:hypothetical protein